MRFQLYTAILLLNVVACQPQEDYKSVRTEVLKEHDRVMVDSERASENRVRLHALLLNLDSLKQHNPDVDTVKVRAEIAELYQQLTAADLQMDTWMKQFDAELGGKSNKEAVTYFQGERLKLRQMDTLFQKLLKESGESLRKY